MPNELQQYIPYPTYKYLGNAGPYLTDNNNHGYWENRNRWGLMGLLSGLGDEIPAIGNPVDTVPIDAIPIDVVAGSPDTSGNLPHSPCYYSTNMASCLAAAPLTSGTGAISAGCITTDPGFVTGLMSWFDYTQWGGDIKDVTSIPTWMCYPMMNLGIVSLPVAIVMGLMFLGGRGSKRGR